MIKAIFIDADNTLLDFGKCSLFAMKKAFRNIGAEFKEEYFHLFHEVNNSLWENHERGEIGKDGIFGVRWKYIFEKIGIKSDPFLFEDDFKANINTFAEKIDGAEELLSYLSKKYEVFVISNAAEKQQVMRFEKAGLTKYLKNIFTSEAIGFSKPDKNFFDKCFSLSGYSPEEVCVIGDSLSADIAGGKACGTKTIWFDLKATRDDKGLEPDMTVQKLSEIEKLI